MGAESGSAEGDLELYCNNWYQFQDFTFQQFVMLFQISDIAPYHDLYTLQYFVWQAGLLHSRQFT